MTTEERIGRITLLEDMLAEQEKRLTGFDSCIEKITLLQELIEKEAQALRFEQS